MKANASQANRDTVTARIHKLVGIALLTAIVVVLQLVAGYIRFGTLSISLVLVPIVVGAALYGVAAGAWLGLAFGVVVLFGTDVTFFANISMAGTVVTVLLKGICCGTGAALVYRLFEKRNRYLAVVLAAIVCPVLNTGIFTLGCLLFFWEGISALAADGSASVMAYFIASFIGVNFLVELVTNCILAPVILRIINVGKKNG